MFDNVGVANSAGVVSALLIGAGIVPILVLHLRGKAWRTKQLHMME